MNINEKNEWLEKVKTPNETTIYGKRGYINVNTPLHLAPIDIQKDRDVVWTALMSGKEYLYAIDKSLRDDKQFILELIANDYSHDIYIHLSDNLKENTDLFKLCVMRDSATEKYDNLPNKILKNKELMIFLSQKQDIYFHIEFAKKYKIIDYSLDREIIHHVIENNPKNFSRIMKSMKKHFYKDIPLMIKVAGTTTESPHYPNAYKDFPLSLQLNEDVSISYLKGGGDYYNIPIQLREQKEFNLKVMSETEMSLQLLTREFRDDYDIVKMALTKGEGSNLSSASDRLRNNKELAELALISTSSISVLGEELLKDKDMVLKFIEAGPYNYIALKNELKDNEDIGVAVMEKNPSLYGNLSSPLQQNWKVLNTFLMNGGAARVHLVRTACPHLRDNTDQELIAHIHDMYRKIQLSEKLHNTLEVKTVTKTKLKV